MEQAPPERPPPDASEGQRRRGGRGWNAVGRMLALVLALALLVALPFAVWGDRIEAIFSVQGALEWMRSTGWAWAAGLALIVSDIVLPIPSTAVIAALGILYGPVLGGLIAALGSVMAGSLGYWVCRAIGPERAARMAGHEGVAQTRELLDRWGFALIALSRWLPVLPETVAFLAGLVRMPYGRFLGALVAGSLPLGLVFATAGHLGQDAPLSVMAGSALAPVVLWLAVRRMLSAR